MGDLPSQAPDAVVAEVTDGAVVYDASRGRVHFLNQTAAVVWELCDGTRSDAEIVRRVQGHYELPHPPDGEVFACLAQLRGEGLVC